MIIHIKPRNGDIKDQNKMIVVCICLGRDQQYSWVLEKKTITEPCLSCPRAL